jgi:hypothetical protein
MLWSILFSEIRLTNCGTEMDLKVSSFFILVRSECCLEPKWCRCQGGWRRHYHALILSHSPVQQPQPHIEESKNNISSPQLNPSRELGILPGTPMSQIDTPIMLRYHSTYGHLADLKSARFSSNARMRKSARSPGRFLIGPIIGWVVP